MLSATELLKQLIEIPSVNPLLPGATAGDGEQKVAAHVADYLRSGGIDVSLQEVREGRGNVIGHLPRNGGADDAVILLTAHMDTYPAAGVRSGYTAVREGHLLYGRGSADAKGALASMLTAFRAAALSPTRREAYVVATVDEECLLLGAQRLAEHGIRATLAITGEPTSLVPIVGQKGIIRGSIRIRGPRSHAAYPTPDDAIGATATLVTAVQQLNTIFVAEHTDPTLGPPTLTLTSIRSDGGMNLVAREVTACFDGRFLPGTSGEEFAGTVETALRELLGDRVDFVLEPLTFASPPNQVTVSEGVPAQFCAIVEDVAGTCEPDVFSYGSEAGVLAGFSEASLVFGPGDARWSHAPTEVIDLRELDAATEMFRRLIVNDG